MAREKFGGAVSDDLVDELDELVDECADLGSSRSEIVEASLTAYFRSDVRELIIRGRKGNL